MIDSPYFFMKTQITSAFTTTSFRVKSKMKQTNKTERK